VTVLVTPSNYLEELGRSGPRKCCYCGGFERGAAATRAQEIVRDDDLFLSDHHLGLFDIHRGLSDSDLGLSDTHLSLSDSDLGLSDDDLGLFNLSSGLPDDDPG